MGKSDSIIQESTSETIKDNKISNLSTCFNIVCLTAGGSIVFLPGAIKKGGALSLILIPLCAILCIYTSKYLIQCLHYKEGSRLKGYGEIGLESFGKYGMIFCQFTNLSLLFSVNLIFIYVTTSNIKGLVPLDWVPNGMYGNFLYSFISSLIILFQYLLVKSIKEAVYLSFMGLLATVFMVFVVCVSSYVKIIDTTYIMSPSYDTIDFSGIFTSFAVILFTYGGIVVYPHIEASMKSPKDWTKMFAYSIFVVGVMYLTLASSGYFIYGNIVEKIIYTNLDRIPRIIAQISITIHIILTAPIVLCSFSLEIEKNIGIVESNQSEDIHRFIFRVFILAVSAVIIGALFDYFTYVLCVATVLNCLAAFIIPVSCNFKLLGYRNKSYFDLFMMCFIFIAGILTCIIDVRNAIIEKDK